MSGEGGTPLAKLQAAIREFQAREVRRVDPKEFRAAIDALKHDLASSPHISDVTGETAEAEE
jgi:hypothetical protein